MIFKIRIAKKATDVNCVVYPPGVTICSATQCFFLKFVTTWYQ